MLNFLEEKNFLNFVLNNPKGGFETMQVKEKDYPYYWIRYEYLDGEAYMLCCKISDGIGIPKTFSYPSECFDYMQKNIFDKQGKDTHYVLSIIEDDPGDERYAVRH